MSIAVPVILLALLFAQVYRVWPNYETEQQEKSEQSDKSSSEDKSEQKDEASSKKSKSGKPDKSPKGDEGSSAPVSKGTRRPQIRSDE